MFETAHYTHRQPDQDLEGTSRHSPFRFSSTRASDVLVAPSRGRLLAPPKVGQVSPRRTRQQSPSPQRREPERRSPRKHSTQTVNKAKYRYECPICNKLWSNYKWMKNHIRRFHDMIATSKFADVSKLENLKQRTPRTQHTQVHNTSDQRNTPDHEQRKRERTRPTGSRMMSTKRVRLSSPSAAEGRPSSSRDVTVASTVTKSTSNTRLQPLQTTAASNERRFSPSLLRGNIPHFPDLSGMPDEPYSCLMLSPNRDMPRVQQQTTAVRVRSVTLTPRRKVARRLDDVVAALSVAARSATTPATTSSEIRTISSQFELDLQKADSLHVKPRKRQLCTSSTSRSVNAPMSTMTGTADSHAQSSTMTLVSSVSAPIASTGMNTQVEVKQKICTEATVVSSVTSIATSDVEVAKRHVVDLYDLALLNMSPLMESPFNRSFTCDSDDIALAATMAGVLMTQNSTLTATSEPLLAEIGFSDALRLLDEQTQSVPEPRADDENVNENLSKEQRDIVPVSLLSSSVVQHIATTSEDSIVDDVNRHEQQLLENDLHVDDVLPETRPCEQSSLLGDNEKHVVGDEVSTESDTRVGNDTHRIPIDDQQHLDDVITASQPQPGQAVTSSVVMVGETVEQSTLHDSDSLRVILDHDDISDGFVAQQQQPRGMAPLASLVTSADANRTTEHVSDDAETRRQFDRNLQRYVFPLNEHGQPARFIAEIVLGI